MSILKTNNHTMKRNKDKISISGRMYYENLETGFWYILDKEDTRWRITNIKNELKKEDLHIKATVLRLENDFSIFMQGIPVEIINFKILN